MFGLMPGLKVMLVVDYEVGLTLMLGIVIGDIIDDVRVSVRFFYWGVS